MLDKLKDKITNMVFSREFPMIIVMMICFGALISTLFRLQIVNGQMYLENFRLTIQKERSISATRGNIYDRNGKLLAYNELAYSVTVEDVFESGKTKNRDLNATILETVHLIESCGDDIDVDFQIELDEDGSYIFNISDSALLRFLADIYGRADVTSLKDKEKRATAETVVEYLCSSEKYGVGTYTYDENEKLCFSPMEGLTKQEILEVLAIRSALSSNAYQKYIATRIATDVNDKTVARISENGWRLDGVKITEDTVRKYVGSVYFCHVVGYTGKISSEKLSEYRENDDSYSLSDQVGISGVEYSMEQELRGKKGYETIFVDNMGRVIESLDYVDSTAGNDVYLTLDYDTQVAAYNILEQKIAGILYSRIDNTKEFIQGDRGSSSIRVPIYDVYTALFENSVISIDHFESPTAGETEMKLKEKYDERIEKVLVSLNQELRETSTPYKKLKTEYQTYVLHVISFLTDKGILVSDRIDREDELYKAWKEEESVSAKEYLMHCIAMGWIDVTKLNVEEDYADSAQIYDTLIQYVLERLPKDSAFEKKVYRFMVKNDIISGREICLVLCEQRVIEVSEAEEKKLKNGGYSAYQFMKDRILNLDITPAQLALEPCSGSMVVTDVTSGDVIALVSYPGYDTNRLANSIDAKYYAKLMSDGSKPMYNHATQEKTAPGSTFKMVSATAGLMENEITTTSTIGCYGAFEKITPPPKCWVSPGAHGLLNVTGAIKNSCNNFFYEVGYRLGISDGSYNSTLGTDKLAYYADLYGLTDTSGVEIEESSPQVASEDSVRAAIGQSNSSYTTVGLSRYVSAVANSGTCYNLTVIDKLTDHNGTLLYENNASVRNIMDMDSRYWDAIHRGMRQVVESKAYYSGMTVHVAGKTGTAQQSQRHPNHALFVSYAPYENPEISCVVRIANGYSSDYAAQAAKDFYAYYYNQEDRSLIITGKAEPGSTAISTDND